MALSDADWQMLLAEVGDDAAQVVTEYRTQVDAYAARNAGYVSTLTTYTSDLQYQFARLKAIDILRGQARTRVSFSEKDRRVQLKELFENLTAMRADALNELSIIKERVGKGQGMGVGQLTATAPKNTVPAGVPDPNDPYFRGQPWTYAPRIKSTSG